MMVIYPRAADVVAHVDLSGARIGTDREPDCGVHTAERHGHPDSAGIPGKSHPNLGIAADRRILGVQPFNSQTNYRVNDRGGCR